MPRKRKYDVHIRMDEKEYMDLQKRHIMSELPITTIILLALKGQDIREKPPAEFYDIFRKLFSIANMIDGLLRKSNENGIDYSYDLKLYRNEITRLAHEISKRYMYKRQLLNYEVAFLLNVFFEYFSNISIINPKTMFSIFCCTS